MKKTVKGFVDSEGNEYQYKDEIARLQNQKFQEHLDNTPYMTVEEGESEDLPVYTIDDTEISVASTWSSEKINGKIQEVFRNASNGKSKLATAIGNGATADMTWDQLASKVLHVNYQKKSGENGVYFDKAFNTVLLWAVAGANYGDDRTGCIIANGLADGNDKINIMQMDSGNDISYSIVARPSRQFSCGPLIISGSLSLRSAGRLFSIMILLSFL